MRIFFAVAACLALLTPPASALTMDWVLVGDPGNAPDTDPNNAKCGTSANQPCGAVATNYNIGKYEVTNAQYADFLNAVDPNAANTLALYDTNMGSSIHGGISFVPSNAAGSKYVPKTNMDTKPINFVSWFDAVRFANWMHNGQGSTSTETGAYTLLGGTSTPSNGPTVKRNGSALVWLPSEDEWYKAAYFNGTTWFDYPAESDAQVTCSTPTATANHANCNFAVGAATSVGAYTGSPSPYGTFDQGGNLWEWNETDRFGNGSTRGLRGASWPDPAVNIAAPDRRSTDPTSQSVYIGFRVASIPEPATALLVVGGLLGLAAWRPRGSRRGGPPRSY